jgi:hypothetical protein
MKWLTSLVSHRLVNMTPMQKSVAESPGVKALDAATIPGLFNLRGIVFLFLSLF